AACRSTASRGSGTTSCTPAPIRTAAATSAATSGKTALGLDKPVWTRARGSNGTRAPGSGALNLGALNVGALNVGALNVGALNVGALNVGGLRVAARALPLRVPARIVRVAVRVAWHVGARSRGGHVVGEEVHEEVTRHLGLFEGLLRQLKGVDIRGRIGGVELCRAGESDPALREQSAKRLLVAEDDLVRAGLLLQDLAEQPPGQGLHHVLSDVLRPLPAALQHADGLAQVGLGVVELAHLQPDAATLHPGLRQARLDQEDLVEDLQSLIHPPGVARGEPL
ncbi:MAG: hypothetical protein EXR69_04175, partial [Myxococcales bacterium]|nr:hypothetical protein [Myxococcales bacterium]